jgi:hypothetical protein
MVDSETTQALLFRSDYGIGDRQRRQWTRQRDRRSYHPRAIPIRSCCSEFGCGAGRLAAQLLARQLPSDCLYRPIEGRRQGSPRVFLKTRTRPRSRVGGLVFPAGIDRGESNAAVRLLRLTAESASLIFATLRFGTVSASTSDFTRTTPQCDISSGRVMRSSRSRVTPPSSFSQRVGCPKAPATSRSA